MVWLFLVSRFQTKSYYLIWVLHQSNKLCAKDRNSTGKIIKVLKPPKEFVALRVINAVKPKFGLFRVAISLLPFLTVFLPSSTVNYSVQYNCVLRKIVSKKEKLITLVKYPVIKIAKSMSTKTYPVTILQECYQSKVFFNKTLQSLNKENATFPK